MPAQGSFDKQFKQQSVLSFPASPSEPAKGVLESLTAMRGVAAVLVAFYHLRWGIVGVPWFDHYIFRFRFGGRGYLWVDFFFMLSGFVLAYRYGAACRKLDVRLYRDFIWRRFARIWPLHVVTMAAALVYLGLKHGASYLSPGSIFANLLLVHGWAHRFNPPLNFPSWSLSSEWGAYLMLPLYLFAIGSIRRGVVHVLIVAGSFALLIWYAARFGHGTLDMLREQWGLGRCLIEVAIGVSLFRLNEILNRCKVARVGTVSLGITELCDGTAAAIFAGIFLALTYTKCDLYFVPLAAALILCLSLAQGPFSTFLQWRPMVLLGEISFSIYMLHGFVLWICQDVPASFKAQLPFWGGALWLICANLLVFGLAYVSFELIERPAHFVLTMKKGQNVTSAREAGVFVLALLTGVVFYFSVQTTQHHFDYTYRIAMRLLRGHVGLATTPPSWLSEMVPMHGHYYSVFPLGAVITNTPFALLRKIGVVDAWPARLLAAAIAGGCVYFFYRLSQVNRMSSPRRILLALFPIFGTWTWCNLGFGGAWQIALGFALLGQAACLYYTLVQRRPILGGAWFAVAFGNRTELLITLPVYIYLLLTHPEHGKNRSALKPRGEGKGNLRIDVGWFLAFPAMLLLCTAVYNLVRFGSIADFGYAHIPGVLQEPWYQHGLFSFYAIRWNAYEMLFRGMGDRLAFPYLQPYPYGCSIFLASPFLFLLFREGGKHRTLCWITIGLLTLILWCHGNPGGWQFSYRYAIVLLPWMFLLIAENGSSVISSTEGALFMVAVLINAMAVHQFLW